MVEGAKGHDDYRTRGVAPSAASKHSGRVPPGQAPFNPDQRSQTRWSRAAATYIDFKVWVGSLTRIVSPSMDEDRADEQFLEGESRYD